ncbi:MAG: NUDIX domain-containing protein [Thermomicrobiales bacterium]
MSEGYRATAPITKRKAFAYIVHGGRIVLLHHPDHPEAGVQVPAGTMEDGEPPEAAVLREAFEETGLPGLRIVRHLGREWIDMRPFGRDEWHDRWFFQLGLAADPDDAHAEAWERIEETPADGSPPIRFLLRWTPLDDLPPLIGRHDRFLRDIVRAP